MSSRLRGLLAALLVTLPLLLAPSATAAPSVGAERPTPTATPPGTAPVPVFAYFYQWFAPSSWRRAKIDYPEVGRYSSDDVRVLRLQVRQAQDAGITGFITSWKSTDVLDRRLRMFLDVARSEGLDVGFVYQALDFYRRPLPLGRVQADMTKLLTSFGDVSSTTLGCPVIIWTGTEQYETSDIATVSKAVRPRGCLLSSAKSVADYERVAALVDGNAYYWSSADPRSPDVRRKLQAMGSAVQRHSGIWIAPSAPGYDARLLGGTRVIERRGGETLRLSYQAALASAPDAIGLISWNEWSENTHVEPSEEARDLYLDELRRLLTDRAPTLGMSVGDSSGDADDASDWTGSRAAVVLLLLVTAAVVARALRGRTVGRSGAGGAGRTEVES